MLSNKRTLFVLSLAALAILLLGAFSVFAQDDTTPTTPPYGDANCGMGMMAGRGMIGNRGMGMMVNWDSSEHPMFVAIAGALGLTTDELSAELQAGNSIVDIATEREVDIQTVYDVALATHEAHLATQVADGTITQEQADAHFAWLEGNIENMPIFGGVAGGMGMMGNCPMMNGANAQGNMGSHGRGRWGH